MRQNRIEPFDLGSGRTLLRPEDRAGALRPEQGIGDVSRAHHLHPPQTRVQAGGVQAGHLLEFGRVRCNLVALGVQEPHAQPGEHANPAIIGCRTAQTDDQPLRTGIQRRHKQLAHTDSGGVHEVALLGVDHAQTDHGGHVQDGRPAPQCQRGSGWAAQGVPHRHRSQWNSHRRGHHLREPFPAI
jgi:hypothetical protein